MQNPPRSVATFHAATACNSEVRVFPGLQPLHSQMIRNLEVDAIGGTGVMFNETFIPGLVMTNIAMGFRWP